MKKPINTCSVCGKHCKTRTGLKSHMRNIHKLEEDRTDYLAVSPVTMPRDLPEIAKKEIRRLKKLIYYERRMRRVEKAKFDPAMKTKTLSSPTPIFAIEPLSSSAKDTNTMEVHIKLVIHVEARPS